MTAYDAVVLAGGSGRRLGGLDKPALLVGGRPLLMWVLDAVADAERTVVVGAPRPVDCPVTWVCEDPPGGGPAAALAAGLPLTAAPWVAVLAADLPLLRPSDVAALRGVAVGEGAVLVDPAGRPQWLAGVWRRTALVALSLSAGSAIGGALGALSPALVGTTGSAWLDCDSPADVERAEELL